MDNSQKNCRITNKNRKKRIDFLVYKMTDANYRTPAMYAAYAGFINDILE